MARQNTDQDQLFVGDFKGMATAGGSYAASPEYLDYLMNATTTREGTIKQRGGSRLLFATSTAAYTETYQFSFGGNDWLLARFGVSFTLYKIIYDLGEPYTLVTHCVKNNVLRSASASEPATYAIKTEGNYCHVLCATASTCLISFCLCLRDVIIKTATATTATADMGQWYQLLNDNSKFIIGDTISPTLTMTNVGRLITATWAITPPSVVVGVKIQLVSCFWIRFVDANYYRGQDLYNNALRRNTIPLDVNVEIPESLRRNYIYNEPNQDLDYETYKVYSTTTTGASSFLKVTNKQPLVSTSWDFSDGSYRAVNTQITTRTPNYVAFGGLESGNVSNKVNVCRLRTILVSSFEYPTITDLAVYVDRALTTGVVYHSFNGTVVTSGEPKYFSFISTASTPPGVPLEGVVEICHTIETTGGVGVNKGVAVDISTSTDQAFIGDGFLIPLYGYSLIARQKSFSFPSVVRIIGNRMLLSGNNRILVSSSDWNYRGVSFNNCQVSTLNFGSNSPYIIDIEQDGGNVKSIASVNGVLIVLTTKYTYRISGATYNSVPTAENAVVSRLTNQTAGRNGLVVFDNQVYLANRNGMYKVAYDRNSDSGVLEELSLPVTNLFTSEPSVVTYSKTLNSILLQFSGNSKLLRYDLLSKTWSYIQIAIPYTIQLFNDVDGFLLVNGLNQILGSWSNIEIYDLINVGIIISFTIAANTASVNTTPTDASFLATPAELQQPISLNGIILPAYNKQSRTLIAPTSVTESTAGNVPKPVISCAVTKALYGAKLTTASRVRDVELLFKQSGQATVALSAVGDERSSPDKQQVWNVNVAASGTTFVTGAYTSENTQPLYPSSDTASVCLSAMGISEAFSVAVQLNGLDLVGFQLNSSTKATRKLQ